MPAWLTAILVKLLLGILDRLVEKAKPTMTEGAGAGPTEERLRDRLVKEGWITPDEESD